MTATRAPRRRLEVSTETVVGEPIDLDRWARLVVAHLLELEGIPARAPGGEEPPRSVGLGTTR